MKLLSSVVIPACLALASLAYGQDPPQGTPTPQKSGDASKVSVTGCLTKGTNANEYLVTDQKTGEKLPFAGPAQLDKYLNQTVKLTGTMAGQGEDKVFKPEAINQVSASCEKSQ
jgi:hypothetical protein